MVNGQHNLVFSTYVENITVVSQQSKLNNLWSTFLHMNTWLKIILVTFWTETTKNKHRS